MPERHVAYWAARRLTDESAAGVEAAVVLAREVQASRKLIARALHAAGEPPTPGFVLTFCDGCEDPWPCPTIQLIDAAELSS